MSHTTSKLHHGCMMMQLRDVAVKVLYHSFLTLAAHPPQMPGSSAIVKDMYFLFYLPFNQVSPIEIRGLFSRET